MTYKLDPELRKIESGVVLIYPDGIRKEYSSGAMAVGDTYDKRYLITRLKAVDNVIEIELEEQGVPVMNWSGEENVSFF